MFLGRLCLYSLYGFLWIFSFFSPTPHFPCQKIDLALILLGLLLASLCYQNRSHKDLGRWTHFLTLIFDLVIHLFFTRTSNYLLSPLMAIHPFLSAAFLLLFHNPAMMLAPLSILPIAMALSLSFSPAANMASLIPQLAIICSLDALGIFFIHLAHSKEHRLLRSMVSMEKKLKDLAIIKERQRISREFHDGVGAKMTSIVLQCDYLQLVSQKDANLVKELSNIKESAVESIDDMRRSIAFLQGTFDVAEQIELMIETMSARHHIPIERYGVDALRALSIEQQIACCRIIQEAVTNALKHAGGKTIIINTETAPKLLRLTVADDGIGIDETINAKHHYGIKNMMHRAQQIGGAFACARRPEGGTKISLEIPTS